MPLYHQSLPTAERESVVTMAILDQRKSSSAEEHSLWLFPVAFRAWKLTEKESSRDLTSSLVLNVWRITQSTANLFVHAVEKQGGDLAPI